MQLPLFNEMYVVERLLKAVTEIDYPRDRLEIQVLDDSTDETVKLAEATVESLQARRASTFTTYTARIARATRRARSKTV